jgi:hypothetical protein
MMNDSFIEVVDVRGDVVGEKRQGSWRHESESTPRDRNVLLAAD